MRGSMKWSPLRAREGVELRAWGAVPYACANHRGASNSSPQVVLSSGLPPRCLVVFHAIKCMNAGCFVDLHNHDTTSWILHLIIGHQTYTARPMTFYSIHNYFPVHAYAHFIHARMHSIYVAMGRFVSAVHSLTLSLVERDVICSSCNFGLLI